MSIQLLLYLLGIVGLVLEAFGVRIGPMSPGWLGLTIIAIAALLLPAIG